MEPILWLMMFVGAVVLATGCLLMVQGRRQHGQAVVVHDVRRGGQQ